MILFLVGVIVGGCVGYSVGHYGISKSEDGFHEAIAKAKEFL